MLTRTLTNDSSTSSVCETRTTLGPNKSGKCDEECGEEWSSRVGTGWTWTDLKSYLGKGPVSVQDGV